MTYNQRVNFFKERKREREQVPFLRTERELEPIHFFSERFEH